MNKNLFRCALYIRKSTQEGLEQTFNSLDAQREACAAYVKKLIETIAKAHDWMGRLIGGREISVASLAREAKVEDGEISRVLALAFLAPDIVEAILSGSQPIELTARHLKRLKPLPPAWPDQRRLLGFAASA